ncbi:hypothetical protein B0H11DRAFT_2240152 [Mycena galericulata]|nr:hypothetical protein B0H11DRAFT_2240152 [Mycena galericulata]
MVASENGGPTFTPSSLPAVPMPPPLVIKEWTHGILQRPPTAHAVADGKRASTSASSAFTPPPPPPPPTPSISCSDHTHMKRGSPKRRHPSPANPDFPVILQWTGGRAGGHHSHEDFHQPVLQTYRVIRPQSNISLVGGSRFGAADDGWPYLSGEWSVHYEMQPMPFDGFLFATRVMVTKEAHTSSSVKDLIVTALVLTTVIGRGLGAQRADPQSTSTGSLLEIVNYNVEVNNSFKIDIAKLTEAFTVEKVEEMLGDIITESYAHATAQQRAEGHIKLEPGVLPFRAYLSKKINAGHLNPDMLMEKYIPNVIAIPFAITKEYAQIIYDRTSFLRLDKALKKWDQERWASDEQLQKLAYIIHVKQYTSPIR